VWAAGTLIAADHAIVHDDDVHDVVEPAGVVAASMKSAARVVPAEMYMGLRTSRAAPRADGTWIVIVPWAVAPLGVSAPAGLAPASATVFGTAGLPIAPPPAQALRLVTNDATTIPSAERVVCLFKYGLRTGPS
jgi:hypothetical protein